jgi:hypothetical protein
VRDTSTKIIPATLSHSSVAALPSADTPAPSKRMSGGKASGKQADQYTGKQPGEGRFVCAPGRRKTSRDTAAAEGDVHAPGHTRRKSMRLPEMSAAKQAGGKGETEKCKLLDTDAFAAALGSIPHDDWGRTWAAGRTIMLRRTSKRVKEVVDKMRLPAVVRLSRSFWDDARNGTAAEKLTFVMRQLLVVTARCRITTLELPRCEMKGQDAGRLAEVLAQCPALALLDLGENNIGPDGPETLAGVLGQCTALAHLDLSENNIGPDGADRLAGVLGQCAALAHLDLSDNKIGEAGAGRLAGVLGQCAALTHLDLSYNEIGEAGEEIFAGVLSHCTALVHLNLSGNRYTALAHLDLTEVQ